MKKILFFLLLAMCSCLLCLYVLIIISPRMRVVDLTKSMWWSNDWSKSIDGYATFYGGSEASFTLQGSKQMLVKVTGLDQDKSIGLEISIDGKSKIYYGNQGILRDILINFTKNKHSIVFRSFCGGNMSCIIRVQGLYIDPHGAIGPHIIWLKKAVVLGDSIGAMYNEKNFFYQFAITHHILLRSAAYNGSTLNKSIGQYGLLNRYKENISGSRFDYIFIEIGANDVSQNYALTSFTSDYMALVSSLKILQPQSKIFLLSLFPRRDKSQEEINAYNASIRMVAQKQQVMYTDLSDLLTTHDLKDYVHPKISVEARIAKQLQTLYPDL